MQACTPETVGIGRDPSYARSTHWKVSLRAHGDKSLASNTTRTAAESGNQKLNNQPDPRLSRVTGLTTLGQLHDTRIASEESRN